MKKLITKITFSVLTLLGPPLITCASPQMFTPIAESLKDNFTNQNGFLLDCTGDSGWTMLLRVNPLKKTVFFISSGPSGDRQQFKPNRFNNVVMWKEGRIISHMNYESNTSVQTIFLEENLLLNTGHYPSGNFHNQLFNCIRK
tara:strand:+ start:4411 stop:4839 length:429 start_codon:yes stop_codon:yes gene_type:complete